MNRESAMCDVCFQTVSFDCNFFLKPPEGRADPYISCGIAVDCMLSPCLFNLYAAYIMRNAGLDEAQAGIKTAGEISIISDMQVHTYSRKRRTKEFLDESEREE